MKFSTLLASALASASASASASTCNPNTLNTTTYLYPITKENTTVADVAKLTNRGLCDIGRQNLMADVTITPNVGQQLVIPPETCTPDDTSCLVPTSGQTRTCIYGGPRLYYTVNGDTYEKIAQRLNITTESLTSTGPGGAASATEVLAAGQYVKVPLCEPSECVLKPYEFSEGVYKDLADRFGSTVGQLMMLSPTYNYSQSLMEESGYPTVNVLVNCTVGRNVTVLT
ncbi:hypothetical protein BDV18DRAFT_157724 [Aspergillus unguis]